MKQVVLVAKKEFATVAFYQKDLIFSVNIASLIISDTNKIYSSHKAQIASLNVDKAITIFLL